MQLKTKMVFTDVLIIGGGTAGCAAALRLGKRPQLQVLVVEKANIRRSGCLAAGVNAINAYINPGQSVEDMVAYARQDAAGIVREDLLYSMARGLNEAVQELEALGLVILKNPDGSYAARGKRNIKINGENIKPLLADAVGLQKNVSVLNHVNLTDYLTEGGRVVGACGFSVNEAVFYEIYAGATICATGGAAGLYRPNNPGFSRHKMWYCPFNTGAGYAMGIRAGAEMTSFEMRFVALRCKDTIAPTGTIAQGVGARQINALGKNYEGDYGLTTSQRVEGTTAENRAGRGPCYLNTRGITSAQEQSLYRAYLNMAPAQTLKWLESGRGPAQQDVEIEGTEPYIVGGHCASGYWVDTRRATTLPGLFAAGDVAGGCPQKYVSGALVEGKLAADGAAEWVQRHSPSRTPSAARQAEECRRAAQAALRRSAGQLAAEQVEQAMQKTMDEYAGGISSGYRYSRKRLALAQEQIAGLQGCLDRLAAADMDELLRIYEVRERLEVCRVLIAHLAARRETRWAGFGVYTDYPDRSPEGEYALNSRMVDGELRVFQRELVKGDRRYEHTDPEG